MNASKEVQGSYTHEETNQKSEDSIIQNEYDKVSDYLYDLSNTSNFNSTCNK